LGYLDYIASVGARLHQHIMVRGHRPYRGTLSLWSGQHILISETNFLTKLSHYLGYLDYIGAWEHVCTRI